MKRLKKPTDTFHHRKHYFTSGSNRHIKKGTIMLMLCQLLGKSSSAIFSVHQFYNSEKNECQGKEISIKHLIIRT